MSLKAKLEAVIYAAEEPVTLTQLAVLFAPEALEWKAEQDAARAASESQILPFRAEGLEYLEQDQPGEAEPTEPVGDPPADPAPVVEPPAATETETPAEVDPEAEAKKQARLRDREVRAILRQLLDEIMAAYVSDGHGVEIREIAGGYRMATKPECHDAVRQFVKSLKPVLKLSLPALETLAVIAYKQPVTAPEVNEIRGVDSSGVFGSLLARKLIATAGRKQVIGRPILYKTTREFLLRFGLKDVSELPSMEEFEKMAALEFDEPETASEEQATAEGQAAEEQALEEQIAVEQIADEQVTDGQVADASEPEGDGGFNPRVETEDSAPALAADDPSAAPQADGDPEVSVTIEVTETPETAVTADHHVEANAEEPAPTEPVAS